MKKEGTYSFALIILFTFLLSESFSKTVENKSLKGKFKEVEVANRPAKNNDPSSPANKVDPKVDSLALKSKLSSVLNKFPFKVTSCNQIAMFKAKYINDLKDYRKRTDGFFTITAYSINLFKDQNAKVLIHSRLWTKTRTATDHLFGAPGCISVDGGDVTANITVCFPDKTQAKYILATIKAFERCRNGDNLQPIPLSLLRQLIQLCGKGELRKKEPSYKKFAMNLKIRAGNKWDYDRQRYFQPKPIKVPGTK